METYGLVFLLVKTHSQSTKILVVLSVYKVHLKLYNKYIINQANKTEVNDYDKNRF